MTRLAHREALAAGEHDTSYIQQTFEHAAAKALTIAIAIRWKTGKLLAAKVGRIPANGHLAELGKTKYGWTTNQSPAACQAALTLAGQAAKPEVTVSCDRAPMYPGLVASSLPAGVSVVPYCTKWQARPTTPPRSEVLADLKIDLCRRRQQRRAAWRERYSAELGACPPYGDLHAADQVEIVTEGVGCGDERERAAVVQVDNGCRAGSVAISAYLVS